MDSIPKSQARPQNGERNEIEEYQARDLVGPCSRRDRRWPPGLVAAVAAVVAVAAAAAVAAAVAA